MADPLRTFNAREVVAIYGRMVDAEWRRFDSACNRATQTPKGPAKTAAEIVAAKLFEAAAKPEKPVLHKEN